MHFFWGFNIILYYWLIQHRFNSYFNLLRQATIKQRNANPVSGRRWFNVVSFVRWNQCAWYKNLRELWWCPLPFWMSSICYFTTTTTTCLERGWHREETIWIRWGLHHCQKKLMQSTITFLRTRSHDLSSFRWLIHVQIFLGMVGVHVPHGCGGHGHHGIFESFPIRVCRSACSGASLLIGRHCYVCVSIFSRP